jgi:hypothetical protein
MYVPAVRLNTRGCLFLPLWITPHPLHSLWISLWITLLQKSGRALLLAPLTLIESSELNLSLIVCPLD